MVAFISRDINRDWEKRGSNTRSAVLREKDDAPEFLNGLLYPIQKLRLRYSRKATPYV